jgi:PAS domain S-box-containing protein
VPLFIAIALLASELLKPVIPHIAEYAFLGAVVIAAWVGGRGPGLASALLAPFVLDYYFLPPLYTWGISAEAKPYIVPFLLSAILAGGMGAARRSARIAAQDAIADLEVSKEKFQRILANLPDVAWTVDQNRRIVYISPKIVDVLGYTSEEIRAGEAKLLTGNIHPDDADRVTHAWDDFFATLKPFDVEYRLRAKDGEWIWIHNRTRETYRERGILFADGLFTDITLRKQAEFELKSKTALLEALLESTIDGILVVDEDLHGRLFNRRFVEIFAFPREILENSDDSHLLRYATQLFKEPEMFLAGIEYFQNHLEAEGRDEIELKDGRVLDRYTAPVRDKTGKYHGRIVNFRDITQSKRNEARLRQLSAAVEQSPASIVITDPAGKIDYVNRKFSECTGYSLEEVRGKKPNILNSGYSPREMYAALWQTIQQGKQWRGEFRNKKKNGEYFWESAAITPIFDQKGEVTHYLGVKEDITERRELEAELRQAQKLEGIGQLAAGIAHEINTPTQFVTDNITFFQDSWGAVSQLLERYRRVNRDYLEKVSPSVAAELRAAEAKLDLDFISEEIPHAIAQSLDGARRVANIVRAMKEFSHPDSANRTGTDLNRAIESTITVARNEWKYVAEMATELDETLPPVVCYPGELNQVILNIIVNAAHAIKDKVKDCEKGKITICSRKRGDFAEIAIADTGMGIPEEIQSRIYEPFFTTKEVGQGTGQGLALAYSVIVNKHQGKLWFETEKGKGTTFFVQLPLETVKSPTEK